MLNSTSKNTLQVHVFKYYILGIFQDLTPFSPLFSAALLRRLGVPEQRPLVLVQFGGFPGLDPLADWPLSQVLHWVAPQPPGGPRADASSLAANGLRVSDALGACDALIAKPGYGTFAEAACNGVPVLFVSRSDWPEEPPLVRWLAQRVPLREIGLADLIAGRVDGLLMQLIQAQRPAPTAPTGIAEATDLIQAMLP